MVNVIKVYLLCEQPEIRRLAVSSEIVNSYNLLEEKILNLFPMVRTRTYSLGWKDGEGDYITMSSDEELAQAVANAEDALIKLFVKMEPTKEDKKDTPIGGASAHYSSNDELHTNVVCDGCNSGVRGFRYKCLQCADYDLCSKCNEAGKHADHDMIKFVKPATAHRQWAFLGIKKMLRSMFGGMPCPKSGDKAKAEKEGDSVDEDHPVVNELCDIIKTLSHTVAPVMKNFADIDIYMDDWPFPTSKKSSRRNSAKGHKKNGDETKKEEAKTPEEGTPKPEEHPKSSEEPKAEAEKVNVEASTEKDENLGAKPKTKSAESSPVHSDKEKSSSSENSENEMTSVTDGWTLLNPAKDDAKKEAASTEAAEPVKEEEKRFKPFEHFRPCETLLDTTFKPLKPVPLFEAEQISQDPKVVNALKKMQAMGFTNEGGWLERLLLTKNGNINEALDSLYPNTQRH